MRIGRTKILGICNVVFPSCYSPPGAVRIVRDRGAANCNGVRRVGRIDATAAQLFSPATVHATTRPNLNPYLELAASGGTLQLLIEKVLQLPVGGLSPNWNCLRQLISQRGFVNVLEAHRDHFLSTCR